MSETEKNGVVPATGQHSRPLVLATLAVIFLASRLIYMLCGVRFDGDLLRSSWALLDPHLLQTDLVRSILYLHSQPPLFNLFVGLVLKASAANSMMIFSVLNLGMGMLLMFSLNEVMCRLGVPFWFSITLAVLFVISPATILFENILFYTFPLALAIVVSALCLERFLRTHRQGYAWSFFALLGAVVLTRSLFHPVWFILIAGGLIILQRGKRRQVVVAAAVPLLLIMAWAVKNQVLFGTSSSSSWLGMSLGKMVTAGVPESERARLVREHTLSPFALRRPFWVLTEYAELLPPRDSSGIPALDEGTRSVGTPNFNNIEYVGISERYLSDAIVLMQLYPGVYFRGVAHALFIFFRPSSDYAVFHINRPSVEGVEKLVNRIFLGQIHYERAVFETNEDKLDLTKQVERTGILIVIVYFCVILSALRAMWRCLRSRSVPDPYCIVSAFMLFTILYVAVIGNVVEIGENNRFRYMVDPIFVILLGCSLTSFFRDRSRKRSMRREDMTAGS